MLAYLALQLGIGIWISRRIKSESDYLLAGRSLGYTLATFSIFATWFGAETMVGSAGNAYRDGVSLGNAEPFGYGLCLILAGFVFAKSNPLAVVAALELDDLGARPLVDLGVVESALQVA